MKHRTLSLAVIISYLSSPLFASPAQAEELTASPSTRSVPVQPLAPQPQVIDIALGTNGLLQGQVLSSAGKPVDGARVSISQNANLVKDLVTTRDGVFTATGLKSGLYEIKGPTKTQFVRVWTAGIAPESAKSALIMVQDKTAMRGQFGYVDPVNATSIILGITGVTLSAITLGKVNDLEDRIARPASP